MKKIITILFLFLLGSSAHAQNIWRPNVPVAIAGSSFSCLYSGPNRPAINIAQCMYNLLNTAELACPGPAAVTHFNWTNIGEAAFLQAQLLSNWNGGVGVTSCSGQQLIVLSETANASLGDLACPTGSTLQPNGVTCLCPQGFSWLQNEQECGTASVPVSHDVYSVKQFSIPCNGQTGTSVPYSFDIVAFSDPITESVNIGITGWQISPQNASMSFLYDQLGTYINPPVFTYVPSGRSCIHACRPTIPGIKATIGGVGGGFVYRVVLQGTMNCQYGNPIIYVNVNDVIGA